MTEPDDPAMPMFPVLIRVECHVRRTIEAVDEAAIYQCDLDIVDTSDLEIDDVQIISVFQLKPPRGVTGG
jgi:hypothetical protein